MLVVGAFVSCDGLVVLGSGAELDDIGLDELDACVDELVTVKEDDVDDGAEVEEATLMGWWIGVQVRIHFLHQRKERKEKKGAGLTVPSSEPGLKERNGESNFATLSLISNFLSCPFRLVGGIQVYVVSRRSPIQESAVEVFKKKCC